MAKRVEPTVEAALELVETTRFGRWSRTLPPHVIRGVLAAESVGNHHLFLKLAVDDDGNDKQLAKAWDRAVQATVDCSQLDSWGSKTRRTRMRALARNARVLQAIQGTVANVTEPSEDMLAVLVSDGSAASIDALVPHVRKDNLELWKKLRVHAKRTPALDALFDEAEQALDDRSATSPALALGPTIGVGTVDPLWFAATLSSDARTGTVPRYMATIELDSRDEDWFAVTLIDLADDERRETRFDHTTLHEDRLTVGRCEPAHLPAWLAHVASTLRFAWFAPYVRTGLRGAKRDQVAIWLCGGAIPKSPAILLAHAIGIEDVEEFWAEVELTSKQGASSKIRIDSRHDDWFLAAISRNDEHSWLASRIDTLNIGGGQPADLPAWLARAAKRLRVTWSKPKLQTNLRGAKRDRLLAWLTGG